MSTEFSHDGWEKLPPCPDYPTQMFEISPHEFICFCGSSDKGYQVSQFDTRTRKWNQYCKIPNITLRSRMVGFDSEKKALYIPVYVNHIFRFIIDTKQSKKILIPTDITVGDNFLLPIDGDIHFIGGNPANHFLFKQNQPEPALSHLCTYGDDAVIQNSHSIYSRQKKIIYTVGGCDEDEEPLDSIYSYNLKTKEQTKLDLKIPGDGREMFGCTMTKNERYIIIFGGWTAFIDHDEIYVLDMEEFTVRKSNIACPKKAGCHVILMDDYTESKVIVNGFIRLIVKQCTDMEFPCDDIILLIMKWVNEEMVYWLSKCSEKSLLRIPLSTILQV